MEKLSVKDARAKFSDAISRVQYRHERILLERHGKPAAALVSPEDLELLERLDPSAPSPPSTTTG